MGRQRTGSLLIFLGVLALAGFFFWIKHSGVGGLTGYMFSRRQEGFRRSRVVNPGEPFDSGAKVIATLEAYHKKYGNYPRELSRLQPEFLSSIPSANWGEGTWEYTSDSLEYSICVHHKSAPYGWHYYSSAARWEFSE